MDIPVDWSKVEDAPYFTLQDLETDAKVVEVYDGDTIKVVFRYEGKLWKWRIRLLDLDAPEVRGSEKVEGIKVRDFFEGHN